MTTGKQISLCVLGFTLAAGLASADRLQFTNSGRDNNWTNPANWTNEKNRDQIGVPGENDVVRLINGVRVNVTGEVTVAAVHLASTGSATLIIDGGKLVTTSTTDYNSACYTAQGSIIVQNGGSATFNSRFYVGYMFAPSGSLIIHDGTVRVADTYYHNKNYSGMEVLGTRTTINPGGYLDVDELVINAGVVDIAGGTLIIRQRLVFGVDQWVESGRMIAMGGKAGWTIKETFDAATGWTTLVAEPMTGPFTVGMLKPAVFVSSLCGG